MLYYIKKYPVSLLIIGVVVYLSFFKPSQADMQEFYFPYADKLVHFGMYLVMSGMLWIEFLKAHRKARVPVWHACVGAFLCPVLFSGVVEVLQSYCTTYRGGDWLDFVANTTGALVASLIGYSLLRKQKAIGNQ